jgi:hypothetical protein
MAPLTPTRMEITMPDLAPPPPTPSNAPESDGTPHASDLPEYLPVAPVVDVPLMVEVAPAPADMPPGVYSGRWPNLVLTATVDENGVMVPVPEATVTP